MGKNELQNKICDLITETTIDPSGESIVEITREIMNLIDEYVESEIVKARLQVMKNFKAV